MLILGSCLTILIILVAIFAPTIEPHDFPTNRNIYFSCVEPIRLYKMAKNKAEEKEMVYELIEKVGLSKDQLKKYPHEISGGQAQRLSSIRDLSLNSKLLICDEPTSMLDVSVQAQILNLLKKQKDHNLSMLYISHVCFYIYSFNIFKYAFYLF
ncbi:ATP-binding cassette domain-containing protein [Clostridium thailandense]|uniref:ATP-binding cassette domain-containing protein n=1 Tax=Clostridium thailandense TaxID=2794346 RepID=UPI00398A04F9